MLNLTTKKLECGILPSVLDDLMISFLPIVTLYLVGGGVAPLNNYDEFYTIIKDSRIGDSRIIGIEFESIFVMDRNFLMPKTIKFVKGKSVIITTDLSYMFSRCGNFNYELDFDTKNVTDMAYMFSECESLRQSFNFDISKSTSTHFMFENTGGSLKRN